MRFGCFVAVQETEIGQAEACMNMSCRTDKTIEGLFSLRYLTAFCKASSLSATIEIFMNEHMPLILKYNIASLGELRFVIGKKVSGDGE